MRALALVLLCPFPQALAQYGAAPNRQFSFTAFPLPNRTAYSVSINSVMDHSMTAVYMPDTTVIAFTGELADRNPADPTRILDRLLYSYQNPTQTAFIANGQYIGTMAVTYLNYDGHPGFDFKTTDQASNGRIAVRAAAAGTVYKDTGNASCNALYIDHHNGYTTHYLHLDSWTQNIEGADVHAGDPIGISGDRGSLGAPHLHFEVKYNGVPVDPYGWQGRYPDPRLQRSTGLWIPGRTASCATVWHPDGSLLSYKGAVYLVAAGQLRAIPDTTVFYAYGFDLANAISVREQEILTFPQGKSLQAPPSNFIINDAGTYYEITDQQRKRSIPSMRVFFGQGFRLSDVREQSAERIPVDAAFPSYNLPYREGAILCPMDEAGRRCAPNTGYYVVSNGQAVSIATDSAFSALGYTFDAAIPASRTSLNCPSTACSTTVITDTRVTGGRIGTCAGNPPNSPTGLTSTVGIK